MKGLWVCDSEVLFWMFCAVLVLFFPNYVNAVSSLTYLFLPLVSIHGEQQGLFWEMCYAMSYQPAGLPCDMGSKRNSGSHLLCQLGQVSALLPGRTSRAKHFSRSHPIFVEYKSFPLQTGHRSLSGLHQALDSPAALFAPSPWSSPNRMFLDEQTFADCLHRVQTAQGFPAPCKLGCLLGR